jgi:hypothetical protein
MRAERLGGTLGVPSTESSEPEVELLALSLSSPPSLSTISPSSRAEAGLGGAGLLERAIAAALLKPFGRPAALRIADFF